MEQNIALEVRFQGETQIYSPSYQTSWEDLYAMLQCSFEAEYISVFYMDDEDDEIALDTQVEYDHAKKIAARSQNVLRLRVHPKDQPMDVDRPAAESEIPAQKSEETVKRKRVHTSSQPYPKAHTPSPSPPIPIPPPRPNAPPRLNRTKSLPAHEQATVTGCVKKAVEELRQLSGAQSPGPITPTKEKELIDHIVRGVLDGLDTSIRDQTRSRSWDPSQDPKGARVSFSPPLLEETGARPKSKSPGSEPILEHSGIICKKCETVICGIRYKCGHCLDFDLCEDCEALSGVHDPNHVFLKLKRPGFRVGMKSDGRMAPIFKHPMYADDDTPVWEYKIKKLEEKIARKAARAELKRKYREEKRRVKMESSSTVSPMKRERIEKMAEKQAEQILAACTFVATPTTTTTTTSATTDSAETTPLLFRKFDASFMRDGNLPDETHLQPKTKFVKSWIMKNTGNVQWDHDSKLKYLWGDIKVLSPDPINIPPLSPGEEGPVCVDFEAPPTPGQYQSHWRLTQEGEQFGHRVWCNIIVNKAEVLEPTCDKKKTVQEEMILPRVQESGPAQRDSTENTPSNAVAHLQTEQSDAAAPLRVVSSSDLLTAQDVLSFELLSIRDDHDVDKEVEGVNSPAATATPNNTPIVGLTPCISPIPQLDEKLLCRRVSEHSDLEIIRREDIPEIIETPDSSDPVPEQPVEGVAIAVQISENEDDVESICSSSDSDMLDDYCVVPLPDCFDPSKPIDKSMILSRTSLTSSMSMTSSVHHSSSENSSLIRLPSYEESQAELEHFSISPCSTPPNEPSPMFQATELPQEIPHEIPQEIFQELTSEGGSMEPEENDETIEGCVRDLEPSLEDASSNDNASVDELLVTSNPTLDTAPLIPLVAATLVEQVSSTPAPESTSPTLRTVNMSPMPEITLLATPPQEPSTAEGGVLINPEGSVLFEARATSEAPIQAEMVRDTERTPSRASEGTSVDEVENTTQPRDGAQTITGPEAERQEEHDDEFHDAPDTPNIHQNIYNDVQFQTDPVDLLGYTAARAVEVAGHVVRQAFGTAASSVNALLRPQPMPTSTPYQPPADQYEPPTPQYQPPTLQYQPPSPTPMEQLIEMGFGDRARNTQLLEKHNEDVSRCVQELLQEEDNDWQNNRH